MKALNVHDKHEINTNLRKTLQQTELIPPLPETAQKILVLRNKPDANLEELVQLIEHDPALAAFVMKYARMAIFGYGERITSVTHAVSLVLGYTTALNVTLGVASSGSLKIPNYGPLGRVRLWSQALECAQLCRELSKCMAKKQFINSGLAYLGGLLHNFGYLLFAHFCPKEFVSLNEMVIQDPHQDIRVLEIQNFGITHDLIGLYLLKAWKLPEEVIMMAAKHHFPDCAGKHALYVKLVATANRLLQKGGIPDSCMHIETSSLLKDLGISESDADRELHKVLECQSELYELANGLMA
ncbi:MAG: HDOD domain-containing protein [Burkholderiales bacterium]|nr:HDOD domain-containing protein [Nitrosomonas sp.]MCP5275179.1 HDOD domain-containing protein [Burkholderiales bacterium]